MKLIAPDYYRAFRCNADKCRHSCCIGWEIDVDREAREHYRHVGGPFGERLNAAIEDGDPAVFRLGVDERCPMLNQNGLCDLITELGEGALCQICADHPRFRSFFSSHTEIGLGLCCEEAARLILSREEPMALITLEEDGAEDIPDEEEEALLAIRDTMIVTMQDRSRLLSERLDEVLALGGLRVPEADWTGTFRELERLDPAWDEALDSLTHAASEPPWELSVAYENFMVYMLYRHLPGAMEDEDIPGRTALCVLSTWMLMALCASKPGCTLADCIEFARMYSAEIEYSQENIDTLLDVLWNGE